MKDLRCYILVNSIMSTIQKGVQAAHAVAELGQICGESPMYAEWVRNQKTIVLLEGGGFSDMIDLFGLLSKSEKPLDWAFFREDKNTFNDQITAFAVILPNVRDTFFENLANPSLRALVRKIAEAPLAR